MSAVDSNSDSAQTVVYIPGIACQVHLGIADDHFRDRLQQAIIALLRPGPQADPSPVTSKTLADDLCIPSGIVESVLLTLEQEGLVDCSDGLFTLADPSTPTGFLRDATGWMFWNCLQKEFLPLLVLDERGSGLPRSSAGEADWLASQRQREAESIPSGAMLNAVRNPDFIIGQLGPDGSIVTANEFQVRCLSREGPRRGWPLPISVEIRPRFGGLPGVFLHEARPFLNWPSEPQFAPHLAKLVEDLLPEVQKELRHRANEIQSSFLHENCAEFLEKLGGVDHVRTEAKQRVEQALAGASLPETFNSPDLQSAASDAELNFILFQNDASLISEASVRRDFATVLQGIGCAIADESAAALENPDLLTSVDQQLKGPLLGRDEFAIKKYWRNRLYELGNQLGCDFGDWTEVGGNLSNVRKFLESIRYPSARHTLGRAFTCWCAVPLLGRSCATAQKHLRWMRAAIADMPDLPARFDELRDTRNEDKSVRSGQTMMPLEEFRNEVYRIWRAVGRNFQN